MVQAVAVVAVQVLAVVAKAVLALEVLCVLFGVLAALVGHHHSHLQMLVLNFWKKYESLY